MPESENGRISFFIGSMRRGGAERVISILANSYAALGWKVDILTFLDDSNDYVLDDRIRFIPACSKVKSKVKRLPFWITTVRRYVKTNKPDRMVSFVTRINLVTLIACLGLNKNIVVSERGDPSAPGRHPFYIKALIRLLYPLAGSVVFQTKWAQSCFPSSIQKKGVILPNPVDVTVEALPRREEKIVAVGRLNEVKNHTMLIDVFRRVHEIHPGYKLYIYGEGGLEKQLKQQVADRSLSDAAFLPGNVLDIHERIADAEIFVLCSNFEGFSNALLEAMMMGLACISTNVSGSNEIIENGVNGLLIERKNPDRLYEAICSLIDDKAAALKMGERAKESVRPMKSGNLFKLWQKCIEQ